MVYVGLESGKQAEGCAAQAKQDMVPPRPRQGRPADSASGGDSGGDRGIRRTRQNKRPCQAGDVLPMPAPVKEEVGESCSSAGRPL
eukprot:g11423.t1